MCHFRYSNCIMDPYFYLQDLRIVKLPIVVLVNQCETPTTKLHFHMQTVVCNIAVLQAWLKLANTVLFYTQTFSSIGANKL